MSAYGTFSPYCATPKGLANTVGAAHTRVRHVAGVQGKTSCTAPSASVSFATPTEMGGVKGDEVVHFTLDALESTQHSP